MKILLKEKLFYLWLLILILFAATDIFGQRTTSIFRSCPGNSPFIIEAKVEIKPNGDINLIPCFGRQLLLNDIPFTQSNSTNATQIRGITVSTNIPNNGQTLIYNQLFNQYVPGNISAGLTEEEVSDLVSSMFLAEQVSYDDNADLLTILFPQEQIEDAVAAMFSAQTEVSYNDTTGKLSVDFPQNFDLSVAASDETTVITTGTAKVIFHITRNFTLSEVFCGLTTASSSGLFTVNIKKNGTTIFGANKLTIDALEKTSLTAATAYNLTTTSYVKGDEIQIDVDTAGTGATGAKCYFLGTE